VVTFLLLGGGESPVRKGKAVSLPTVEVEVWRGGPHCHLVGMKVPAPYSDFSDTCAWT
jgi:hypothetical protein